MSKDIRARVKGLVTQPGVNVRKPGSMTTATNLVFNRPGVAEPRQGFALWTTGGVYTNELYGCIEHPVYASGDLVVAAQAAIYRATTAGFTAYTAPSGADDNAPTERTNRRAMVGCKKNLYATCEDGVYRLGSSQAAYMERIGQFPCFFDKENCAVTDRTVSGYNWLADDYGVSYRALLKKRDAQGDWLVGPVSGRVTIINEAGAARAVSLRILIPKGAGEIQNSGATTPNYFDGYYVEVYRSGQAALGTVPGDEMQLVVEQALVTGDVTNGYVTVIDDVPDTLRQAHLYTNAGSGTGIESSRTTPPRATDLAVWKERLWGSNIRSVARLELQVMAVGGTNGIQDEEELSFNLGAVTFTVNAEATTPGANEYLLVTSYASAAQNIEATTQNICAAINKHATNTVVWAEYVASPTDPLSVGRFVVYSRKPTASRLYAYVGTGDKAEAFLPTLPIAATGNVYGEADDWVDAVWFSEAGLPDAVPVPNFLRVGQPGKAIHRIVPTRDRLYVFKEDGAFVVTGDNPDTFAVTQLDPGMRLLAPESLVSFDGMVVGWFTTGIMAFSTDGIEELSAPISETVRQLVYKGGAAYFNNVFKYAFACADENQKRYILFLPDVKEGYTYATVAYVFNAKAGEWTTWSFADNITFAYSAQGDSTTPDRRLYLGWYQSSTNGAIQQQRNNNISSDYQDRAGASLSVTWAHVYETGSDPGAMKQFVEVAPLLEASMGNTALSLVSASEFTSLASQALGTGTADIRRTYLGLYGRRLTLTFSATLSQTSFQYSGYSLALRNIGGSPTR